MAENEECIVFVVVFKKRQTTMKDNESVIIGCKISLYSQLFLQQNSKTMIKKQLAALRTKLTLIFETIITRVT